MASAPIRPPIVQTPLMTQARNFFTLVHIGTDHLIRSIFEPFLTITPVRSDRIDTVGVLLANFRTVHCTLVNILAALVPTDHMPRWTNANVTSLFVLAGLLWTTDCLAGSTFVDV